MRVVTKWGRDTYIYRLNKCIYFYLLESQFVAFVTSQNVWFQQLVLNRFSSVTMSYPPFGRPDNAGIHVSVTCCDSAVTPSVQRLLRRNAPSLSLTVTKLEKVHAKHGC